jgi:hypothetical protein
MGAKTGDQRPGNGKSCDSGDRAVLSLHPSFAVLVAKQRVSGLARWPLYVFISELVTTVGATDNPSRHEILHDF